MTGRSWICCLAGLAALAAALAGCDDGSKKAMTIDSGQAYVDARSALLQAADDPNPELRMNALEALAATEGAAAGAVLADGLLDDRLPVLAAAALAVGETRYAPAKERLLEIAGSPNVPPKLKCALIYALHSLGDHTYTGELAALLYHEDKWVRAETARVMGLMGEPSARDLLKAVQRDDRDVLVRMQVAEALVRLGDERSIELLGAFTKSQFRDDKLIAVQALGEARGRRAMLALNRLMRDGKEDPVVRVAAAGSLARLGSTSGYGMAMEAATTPAEALQIAHGKKAKIGEQEVAMLQLQAVVALEAMGDPAAVDALHPLMQGGQGRVRIAAARAILKLLRSQRPAAMPAPEPQTPPQAGADEPPASQPVIVPALHTSGGKD